VIAAAEEAGCGFDSWTEYARPDIWARVFKEHGIQPEWWLRRRPSVSRASSQSGPASDPIGAGSGF
jgi:hypothetical protein